MCRLQAMVQANRERNKEQNLMHKELASLLGVSLARSLFLSKIVLICHSTIRKHSTRDMINLDWTLRQRWTSMTSYPWTSR